MLVASFQFQAAPTYFVLLMLSALSLMLMSVLAVAGNLRGRMNEWRSGEH
jgi:hypothetical protein